MSMRRIGPSRRDAPSSKQLQGLRSAMRAYSHNIEIQKTLLACYSVRSKILLASKLTHQTLLSGRLRSTLMCSNNSSNGIDCIVAAELAFLFPNDDVVDAFGRPRCIVAQRPPLGASYSVVCFQSGTRSATEEQPHQICRHAMCDRSTASLTLQAFLLVSASRLGRTLLNTSAS